MIEWVGAVMFGVLSAVLLGTSFGLDSPIAYAAIGLTAGAVWKVSFLPLFEALNELVGRRGR